MSKTSINDSYIMSKTSINDPLNPSEMGEKKSPRRPRCSAASLAFCTSLMLWRMRLVALRCRNVAQRKVGICCSGGCGTVTGNQQKNFRFTRCVYIYTHYIYMYIYIQCVYIQYRYIVYIQYILYIYIVVYIYTIYIYTIYIGQLLHVMTIPIFQEVNSKFRDDLPQQGCFEIFQRMRCSVAQRLS